MNEERGFIKWFNSAKGYGFITRPTGADIFVHASAIEQTDNTVHSGEQVEYLISVGPKGIQAESVHRIIVISQ